MGMIERMFGLLFGNGGNVVRDTVEVFRENAEAGSARAHEVQVQAMRQFGAEYAVARQGWFDRFVDGLNRLPRPMLAFGTLGLFVSAMVEPLWFAERMQGIALVPEPLSCRSISARAIRSKRRNFSARLSAPWPMSRKSWTTSAPCVPCAPTASVWPTPATTRA